MSRLSSLWQRECIPPSNRQCPLPTPSISASFGAAAAIGYLWLLRRSLPLSLACHRSPYHRRRRPSSAHSHSYPTPFLACLPTSPPLFSLLSVRVGGRPHTPQKATRSGCGREGSRHRLCPGHAHLAEGSTRALVRSHCELQLQEAHRDPPAATSVVPVVRERADL